MTIPPFLFVCGFDRFLLLTGGERKIKNKMESPVSSAGGIIFTSARNLLQLHQTSLVLCIISFYVHVCLTEPKLIDSLLNRA